MPTKSSLIPLITPGAQVVVRDEDWLVRSVVDTPADGRLVRVTGISELVFDTEAAFFTSLDDIELVLPEETFLVADESGGYRRSRLWLEAVLRKAPVPVSDSRLTTGHRQLLAELRYQRIPAHKALESLRPRLLIADAVGLGKTLEIGITLSELIRRGRGDRILVVTPRAILEQFQHELWTRFSIGLVRLDSEGIQQVRQKIPPTRNPFTYFKRVIVLQARHRLDRHAEAGRPLPPSARERHVGRGGDRRGAQPHQCVVTAQYARQGPRAAHRRAHPASATPHNGKAESFAELVRLLDPAAIANPKTYRREEVQHLYVQRFKKDVSSEVGENFADRLPPKTIGVSATPHEEAVLADIADHWISRDRSAKTGVGDSSVVETTWSSLVSTDPSATVGPERTATVVLIAAVDGPVPPPQSASSIPATARVTTLSIRPEGLIRSPPT